MGRIAVVGVAYRRWALDILEPVAAPEDIDLTVINHPSGVDIENIKSVRPALILFYGWSWKVPQEILDAYLCLCLHPSPLPKYRGGSPLQHQIIAGEVKSAVSIFRMTGEMDAGDLCSQVPFTIDGDLWFILDEISSIGRNQTLRIIREHQAGTLRFWSQEGEPTVFKRRTPEESEITADELATSSARDLHNKIRALQAPYPLPFIRCADGEKLYITGAVCDE